MSETETPATAGKGNKNKAAQGATKQRDNGFRVLSTVNVKPERLTFSEKLVGRTRPVSEAETIQLAESMRTRGQQQPIQVRENPTRPGYYAVVFGNTRGRAGLLLTTGYAVSETKRVEGNPEFTLRAEIVDCDDETAFVHNVVENAARVQCSAIDNAKNQARLREEFGMSDVAIAKLYGFASSASVSRLKKLLQLPEEIQESVHTGDCTQTAAFLLADFIGQKIHGADVEGTDVTTVYLYAVDASGKGEPVTAEGMVSAIKRIRSERAPAKEPKPEAPAGEPGAESVPVPEGTEGTEGAEGATDEPGTKPTAEGAETVVPMTLKQFKDMLKEIKAAEACPVNVGNALQLILNTLAGDVEAAGFAQFFARNLK